MWRVVGSLAVLLRFAACDQTRPCRDNTVFLTIAYDTAARQADQVRLSVAVAGKMTSAVRAHASGQSADTIEIDLLPGYPRGSQIAIDVTALRAAALLGAGHLHATLGGSCAALTLSIDGGAPPNDMAPAADLLRPTADLATTADLTSTTDLAPAAPDLGNRITLLGVTTSSYAYVTTVSISAPVAPVGSTLVAWLSMGDTANASQPTFAAPAGWNLISRTDHGTIGSLVIYSHVVGTSEPASYTWQSSLVVHGVSWIAAYSGVATSSPVEVETSADLNTSTTSYTAPSIVVSVPGSMVVATVVAYNAGPPPVWTLPPGVDVLANLNNAANRSGAAVECWQTMSGSTMPVTFSNTLAQDWAIVDTLALRPGP